MSMKPSSGSVRVLSLAVVSALAIGLASARPAVAQVGYVVQDLGALAGDSSSVAWAINANGDVVGWSNGQAGTRAFLYTDAGGMVALPGLPNRPRTVARDINDAGVIVGSANAGGTDLGHAVALERRIRRGPRHARHRLVQRGLGREQPRSGRRLVLHERRQPGSARLPVHPGGWAGRPHTGQRLRLRHGHQRRGPGDRLQDGVRRLSTRFVGKVEHSWTWASCPGSRTALAGPSTRPARWPAARPRLRATANGSSVPPTAGISRIWGARASTTRPGASTHRGRWSASAGNRRSAPSCTPTRPGYTTSVR